MERGSEPRLGRRDVIESAGDPLMRRTALSCAGYRCALVCRAAFLPHDHSWRFRGHGCATDVCGLFTGLPARPSPRLDLSSEQCSNERRAMERNITKEIDAVIVERARSHSDGLGSAEEVPTSRLCDAVTRRPCDGFGQRRRIDVLMALQEAMDAMLDPEGDDAGGASKRVSMRDPTKRSDAHGEVTHFDASEVASDHDHRSDGGVRRRFAQVDRLRALRAAGDADPDGGCVAPDAVVMRGSPNLGVGQRARQNERCDRGESLAPIASDAETVARGDHSVQEFPSVYEQPTPESQTSDHVPSPADTPPVRRAGSVGRSLRKSVGGARIPTGFAAIDDALGGGLPWRGVHEWMWEWTWGGGAKSPQARDFVPLPLGLLVALVRALFPVVCGVGRREIFWIGQRVWPSPRTLVDMRSESPGWLLAKSFFIATTPTGLPPDGMPHEMLPTGAPTGTLNGAFDGASSLRQRGRLQATGPPMGGLQDHERDAGAPRAGAASNVLRAGLSVGIEWAIEQAIRAEAVGLVVADGSGLSMAASRRLHVAMTARATPQLVLLARAPGDINMLTAALTRWLVAPCDESTSPQARAGEGPIRECVGGGHPQSQSQCQPRCQSSPRLDGHPVSKGDSGLLWQVRMAACKASLRCGCSL